MRRRKQPEGQTGSRRAALAAGWTAERVAVLLLRLKGYRILVRRYLVRGGEIDIVAQRGRTVAFVEVKLRASLGSAQTSISAEKQRRLSHAARAFVSRQRATDLVYRADAIYVAPWRVPMHVEAAFELEMG